MMMTHLYFKSRSYILCALVLFVLTTSGKCDPPPIINPPPEDVNSPPTGLTLNPLTVSENEPSATQVGTFSTTDTDADQSFTYSLVDGEGDTDNSSFVISDTSLNTGVVFDFETQSSYSVRVQTDDGNGGTFQISFTIAVTDVNDAPTALILSSSTVCENQASGAQVGTLSAEDQDNDTHSFSLVDGEGDADNGSFAIEGLNLNTGAVLDFETQSSYTIRIQANDGANGTFAQAFTITVTDIEPEGTGPNNPPTAIALSNAVVAENESIGALIGTLTTTDVDTSDIHSYSLVAGTGDTDNGLFSISGNTLLLAGALDYETDSTLTIRLQTDDSNGGIFEMILPIGVSDIDETLTNNPPTAIALSNAVVAENESRGTLIGRLTTEDADISDIHSYSLVDGTGNADNDLFFISGDSLLSAEAFDYETDSILDIRLQTDDSNEGTFEMTFTINVSDIDEPPSITADTFSVSEFASVGDTLGQITANDDVGITVYTLVSGNIGDAFELTSAGFLRLAATLNFETLATYTLGIEVRDAAGNSAEADFSIAVRDSFQLLSVANVTDDGTLELDGAASVSTADVSGTTYLFVAGRVDNGVSVFRVASDGALTSVFNIEDNGSLELDGARSVSTAVVSDTTYLFVAGFDDSGVSVFRVASDGALTSVFNITDAGTLELDGAISVSTAVVSDTTYLFVAGFFDDGVSVFRQVASDGALTPVFDIDDDGTLQLAGAVSVSTAVVSDTTYLFVAGRNDNGVSVFRVASDGALTSVFNITDDGTLALNEARSVSTAVVSGTTYLFVAGQLDNGVSVFRVTSDGALTSVFNIGDNGTLALNGANSISTAVVSGTTYLFVSEFTDAGVSVFRVASDGALTSVFNISDGGPLALNGAASVSTAVVSGMTYLFVAGQLDNGVSVFRVLD